MNELCNLFEFEVKKKLFLTNKETISVTECDFPIKIGIVVVRMKDNILIIDLDLDSIQ